jgi:hypothetical protein
MKRGMLNVEANEKNAEDWNVVDRAGCTEDDTTSRLAQLRQCAKYCAGHEA